MEVTISNKLLLQQVPDNLLDIILPELILPNPKFVEAAENGYSTYGIPEKIINYDIKPGGKIYVPRGYFSNIVSYSNALAIPINITDQRADRHLDIEIDSSVIKLRPYQSKALVDITSKSREGILVSPAGSGKTVMGLSLLPMLEQKTLWLTHTKPLAQQALSRIEKFLPSLKEDDVGFIGTGKWNIGKVITIGIVQTLVRNMDKIKELRDEWGLVILDECHHAPATSFTNVIAELAPLFLYGLSATPIRRDGLHNVMFQVMGPILHTVSLKEVKQHGGIIVPKIYCKRILNNYLALADFQSIINALVNDVQRTLTIVDDVVKEAKEGNICVVLTDRKLHAERIFELLKARLGNTVGIATGSYSKKKIDATVKQLEDEEINVLVTTSALLGEGFDHAPINRGFLCLPFRNATKTEQVIGRIQRTAEGKEDAIVYDYVDTHPLLEHQFYNRGMKGCRHNIYQKLGCVVEKI